MRERSATIAGATTRWWEYGAGDGPLLIVVHGFRGDHHGLEKVVALLPGFRVVGPDLPGFGASGTLPGAHTVEGYADWLIAFAEHVSDGTRYTALGHSFGSIVLAAALDRGLRPHRVVLVNPIAGPAAKGPNPGGYWLTKAYYGIGAALPERAGRAWLASPPTVRAMSVLTATTRDRALRRWIHEEHDRYFSGFASRDSVIEGFRASIGDDVSRHVDAFTMPTLLIAAAQDQVVRLRDVEALHAAIPGSELLVIDGVGHLIHYEKADEAAAAIRAFAGGGP